MSDDAKNLQTEAQTFKSWANAYLKNFYIRVIDKWGTPFVDGDMWSDLIKRSKGNKDIPFYSLDDLKVVNIANVTIDNKYFSGFAPILKEMFDKELSDNPENIQSLLEIKPEKLSIIREVINIPNNVGTKEFVDNVHDILSSGETIWKTSAYVGQMLKISMRDFEEWAATQENILCKQSELGGIFYYALEDRLSIPELGTEDFLKYIISRFDQGKNKPWKSGKYLAQSVFVNQNDFEEWANNCPALMRRVSTKDKDVFYYRPFDDLKAGKEENGSDNKKIEKEPVKRKAKRSVKDYEYMCIGQLHTIAKQLVSVLDTYGHKIAMRDINILSYLTNSQKNLLNGLTLLRKELKIEECKLPVFED